MKVHITKHVPGLVNFQPLTAGEDHDLEEAVAVSLINDGYAARVGVQEVSRSAPAERRETASVNPGKRGPGRPPRNG